jgi:hypothetical protein
VVLQGPNRILLLAQMSDIWLSLLTQQPCSSGVRPGAGGGGGVVPQVPRLPQRLRPAPGLGPVRPSASLMYPAASCFPCTTLSLGCGGCRCCVDALRRLS